MKRTLLILSTILVLLFITGCSWFSGEKFEPEEMIEDKGMIDEQEIMDEKETTDEGELKVEIDKANNDEDSDKVGEYTDLTPEEAKEMIDENDDLVVIDVSPHYDEGHLPGAVSYYLGDGSLDAAIPELDPSGEYLVYCHVESVSRQGAQALIDAGFGNVYRLDGDYPAWVDAGYSVEK